MFLNKFSDSHFSYNFRQINDFVKSLPNFRSGNCLADTITGGLVYNKQGIKE